MSNAKANIAVLVSGGGTNLQALIDAEKSGVLKSGTIRLVISNKKGKVLLVQNQDGGLLKGLWELPAIKPTADIVQVFSHFRQEMSVHKVTRSAARFTDPRTVPLTTATRKALVACELL